MLNRGQAFAKEQRGAPRFSVFRPAFTMFSATLSMKHVDDVTAYASLSTSGDIVRAVCVRACAYAHAFFL